MKKSKQLGIWMDHSKAFIMELSNNTIVESIIVSEIINQEKESSLVKDGKNMNNKEQQQRSSYYKKLSVIIIKHQEVVLFGPTDAKNELFNLLRTDHLFNNIKIEIINSDKMTVYKMHDFVRNYFSS